VDQRNDNDARQPPSVIHIRIPKGLLPGGDTGVPSISANDSSSFNLGGDIGGNTIPQEPSDGKNFYGPAIPKHPTAKEPHRAKVLDRTKVPEVGEKHCDDDCNQKPVLIGDTHPTDSAVPRTFRKTWPTRLKSLMTRMDKAIRWKPSSPFDATELLRFEMTMEAAEENLKVLSRYNFDLHQAIMDPEAANTPLRPGSEFRPLDLLDPICENHPLWPRIRRTLAQGFTMPLKELPDAHRRIDVLEALKYGNHKSTQKNPAMVLEMLKEEVERGWQLVLPCANTPTIP
jgi:hypothetical protein